ncbi:hypothetical protein EDD21DRAFT_54665 [Dissophora ornata]|nr:hypothetical protein EDD21DRAFT_54665 [Dissophora ornata]
MSSNIRSHSRQESLTDKFMRSISPPPAMNRDQPYSGHKQSDLHDNHTQQYLQNYLTPPNFLDQEHRAPSPSKKTSSNNFLRKARQASDTAFRNVRLNRKTSDSNLNTTWKDESPDSTGVYEQNPRVYLYQQQTSNNPPPRPQHSRPHSDDNVSADWVTNNQILHSEPTQHNDCNDPHQLHSTTERLRRNASLPDMKVEYSKDGNEPAPARPASPANISPGQATNSSQSRPRVQPHHFIATAMSNEPVSASSLDGGESDLSQQLCKDQVYRPETPLRGSSRTARTRPNNPQQTYKDQHRQLPKSQLEQRKGLLARHQILSDESLSKDVKIRLSQDSKDFPPAPPAPLQTASRIRHRTEGGDGESSPLPDLPAASETLMKIESSGLIPQDVLKNMDPKDMKRAMMATVIASRVYKVMSSEQLEILKKVRLTD